MIEANGPGRSSTMGKDRTRTRPVQVDHSVTQDMRVRRATILAIIDQKPDLPCIPHVSVPDFQGSSTHSVLWGTYPSDTLHKRIRFTYRTSTPDFVPFDNALRRHKHSHYFSHYPFHRPDTTPATSYDRHIRNDTELTGRAQPVLAST